VRLSVQDRLLDYSVRYEKDFPIARTEYRTLYLDALHASLSADKPRDEAKVTYDSAVSAVSQIIHTESRVGPGGRASFRITFTDDTEVTGFMKLKVWVSPDESDDMDLFVTVRKYNAGGHQVCFDCDAAPGRAPVARGWLRLSRRELDEKLSRPWWPVPRSVAPGQPGQKVRPGEIVPCEIAIWPSSTVFHAGESLAVDVSGRYGVKDDLLRGFNSLVNRGRHSIYTGGTYDSHLLVPVIPEARAYGTFGGRLVAAD